MSLFAVFAVLVLGPTGHHAFDDDLAVAREAQAEGRLDDAERHYRELVTRYPQQVPAYQGLAEVFAAQGHVDAAVSLLVDVGRELVKVSRERAAIAPLEQAVALAPENAGAQALLGRVLGGERRYREAVAALEQAVEHGSEHLETFMYLASSYWETARYAEAETAYRRALERYGDAFGPLHHYGQFLLWQGRAAEAVGYLEKAANQKGDDVGVLVFLARARAESGDTKGAMALYERVLTLDASDEKARNALGILRARERSVGAEEPPPQGRATGRATGPARRLVLTPVARDAGLRFRHDPGVTEARHLPETMGSGLAWLDYDGDGWQDVYLVQSGPFPPAGSPAAANRLFRNRGAGADGRAAFEDVTERSGAGDRSYGMGAVAADVDGDGDVDLFVTNYGPDVLLMNRGDGTFEDASVRAGLALGGWSSSAALADGDGDGDLDLFVTGYVDYDADHGAFCGDASTGRPDYCNVVFFPGTDDAYFRQRADGTFDEVTLASGFENPAGRGLGVVFTDLDGDGRPDVYVANDLDPNRLYLNRGAGADGRVAFEDVSLLSGAAYNREGKAEAGMGVAVGDVDGDSLPDLAVTNFDVETNTLYRNLGGGHFDDVSATSGFGLPSFNLLGFGVVLADFDLDGDLDAYVANGHVFERPTRDTVDRAQPDLVLLGDGRGGFVDRRWQAPARLSRGAAAADYDGDGDPDVAVQSNGSETQLWRNDGERDGVRWWGVELVGRPRNTQAVGARVELRTDRRRQVRWVVAGESYQSSGERRVVFGGGAGEEIQELAVRWPSGRLERWRRPPPGRYLRFFEP